MNVTNLGGISSFTRNYSSENYSNAGQVASPSVFNQTAPSPCLMCVNYRVPCVHKPKTRWRVELRVCKNFSSEIVPFPGLLVPKPARLRRRSGTLAIDKVVWQQAMATRDHFSPMPALNYVDDINWSRHLAHSLPT